MNQLSIQKILLEIKNTCVRFPFAMLFAMLSSVSLILAINSETKHNDEEFFIKIGLFNFLGFWASISPVLLAESKNWKKISSYLLQFVVTGLVVLYYFISPELPHFNTIDTGIFTSILILAFTFVSILPFLTKNNQMGFWEFNRSIVFRFFISCLYAGILWGGIALGLMSIRFLFDVNIVSVRYPQLLFILFGFFGSCFFLTGIPQKYSTQDTEFSYPKGLKFFTQYILLALIILYFIILYVYAARILVLWELPKGWVSYLVLTLSGITMLAFLFVWPIRNDKNSNWVRLYSKYLYLLLLPLLVLLFVAIGRRIADYGFTINRYYVLVAACWVTGLCFYFLLSKKKDIRVIPFSLSFLVALAMVGPLSAFSVSIKSQTHRLETILKQNKILIDGKIDPKHPALRDNIEADINSVLNFLEKTSALQTLEKRWNTNLSDATISSSIDRYTVAKALNLKSTNTDSSFEEGIEGERINFYTSDNGLIDVAEYDDLIYDKNIYHNEYSSNTLRFKIDNDNYIIVGSHLQDSLHVLRNDTLIYQLPYKHVYTQFKNLEENKAKTTDDDLAGSVDIVIKKANLNKNVQFSFDTPKNEFKLLINRMEGFIKKDSVFVVENMAISVLIKEK